MKQRKPGTVSGNFKAGADLSAGLSGRRPLYDHDHRADHSHQIERANGPDREKQEQDWQDQWEKDVPY